MNTKVFYAMYTEVQQAVQALTQEAALRQLSQREQERTHIDDFQISEMTEDCVTLSTEYNDSCGCHPEYTRAYINIPWADIETQLGG